MDAALQAQLGAALQTVIAQINAADLPDIAQQYVIYGRVLSTLTLVFDIGVFWLAIRLSKEASHQPDGSKTAWVVWTLTQVSWLLGCAMGVFTALHVPEFVSAWFAPKVYVLHQIAGLIHG